MDKNEYFVLKTETNGLDQQCVDIYDSYAIEGKEMKMWSDVHKGVNQTWTFQEGQIRAFITPHLCLGVKQVQDGAKVCLLKTSDKDCNTKWVLKDDKSIILESHPEFGLSCDKSDLIIRHQEVDGGCCDWSLVHVEPHIGANSCHLWYKEMPSDKELAQSKVWRLENTINVKEAADSTYFMVIGWNCGYCGIQQIEENNRVAIFSLWDQNDNDIEDNALYDNDKSAKEVSHGPGVCVTSFGGEGTGLKSMKSVQWKENVDITFIVEGKKRDFILNCCGLGHGEYDSWNISCWYRIDNGPKQFMATFKRFFCSDEAPLRNGGFYSFIEDWTGNPPGHKKCRKAEFKNPKIICDNQREIRLESVKFTKNEYVKVSMDKAKGGVDIAGKSFFLSTGGEEELVRDCNVVPTNSIFQMQSCSA